MEGTMNCAMSESLIEEGKLPFTWIDALHSFEPGQTKFYRITGGAMISTVRSHISRFQNATGRKFSSRCEGEFIYITRIK